MRSVLRRARSSRVLAALLCGLFLLADLASSLHDSTVRHILCPEHGEWEHVAAAAGSDVRACAHDDGSQASPRYHREPRQGGAEHEHCSLVMIGRTPFCHSTDHVPALGASDESAALALAPEQELRERVAFGAFLARGPPARS